MKGARAQASVPMNHDPNTPNQLSYDSQELKEKIEIALDPSTTKKQIEDGDL